jgi:CDP-2,3-bis-(O-geranylgeranyl)-sn-glycerol synthase
MILLTAFWLFLPAGIANMGPVFAAKLPGLKQWNASLDLGHTYRGKRIFGPHKTWRGLLAGVVLASVVVALQKYLHARHGWAQDISWINYQTVSVWLLGALLGAGALLGDAIESFFKRQKGVASGQAWFPFDQTDYIMGGLLFVSPIADLSLGLILSVFVIYFGLHLVVAYVGYRFGLKENPI